MGSVRLPKKSQALLDDDEVRQLYLGG